MSNDSAAASSLALSQHFLIAMPGMEDDDFAQSVVYLFDHDEQGALGLCINKLTDSPLDGLFEQMHWTLRRTDLVGSKMLWGGPVRPEAGFVLHSRMTEPDSDEPLYNASKLIAPDVQLTTSRDVLQQLAEGQGPEKMLIALGCSSWVGGQLEDEIARNSWLTVPADSRLIFDTPIEQRWEQALRLLGIEPTMLSAEVGRA